MTSATQQVKLYIKAFAIQTVQQQELQLRQLCSYTMAIASQVAKVQVLEEI